jgi:hypothetical protein
MPGGGIRRKVSAVPLRDEQAAVRLRDEQAALPRWLLSDAEIDALQRAIAHADELALPPSHSLHRRKICRRNRPESTQKVRNPSYFGKQWGIGEWDARAVKCEQRRVSLHSEPLYFGHVRAGQVRNGPGSRWSYVGAELSCATRSVAFGKDPTVVKRVLNLIYSIQVLFSN